MSRTDAMSVQALRNVRRVLTIQETTGTASSASSAWVTLVSITATRGWIYQLRGTLTTTSATNPQLRVTVDGGTPQTFSILSALPQWTTSTTTTITLPIIGVRFDSSLLIEFSQTSATSVAGTANAVWGSR